MHGLNAYDGRRRASGPTPNTRRNQLANTRSARPGPGRARETYGDVGRVIEKAKIERHDDYEANQALFDAVAAAEPKRRYAVVQDAEGHRWERGTTRWTCLSPVNGRDVTAVGRLGWSSLVSMYGPITVVDENLPAPKTPAKRATAAIGDSVTAVKSRVRTLAKELEDEADVLTIEAMQMHGKPMYREEAGEKVLDFDGWNRVHYGKLGKAEELRAMAERIRATVKG